MELGGEGQLIEPASFDKGPVVSATVGRVMTTLLGAKPKKLQEAISLLYNPPKMAPVTDSLEQSLWFLHKYVREAAERDEHLDEVLLPIIQKSLTATMSRHGNQELILLNWLFKDEILFQAVVRNLAAIILRRDDRYMALGWCILGRSLIEYENVAKIVPTMAIREKNNAIIQIFSSCVIHLISIICNGSNMKDGFELPTRLAVAAADFILSLTVALTRKELESSNIVTDEKLYAAHYKNQPTNLLAPATDDREDNALGKESELPTGLKSKLLLWNNLSEIITLIEKLINWSKRSRLLHSKGLERVSNWLQEMKQHHIQDSQVPKTDLLLLSSCWKHYGVLLHLEDSKFSLRYKDLLDQYLSGIQFYADNRAEEPNMNISSKSETINFFLNCLLLLLGRLDNQQFDGVITDLGSQISQVLMSQLRSADEEVIDGAISIFKALIFGTNHKLSRKHIGDTKQVDALLPMLLNLLDERDAAAKAIAMLIGEYCASCSDNYLLYEVLKCLDSKNVARRMNGVDVLAAIIYISQADDALPQGAWRDIANHLFKCLGDEDPYIQDQAANLIAMLDPTLVVPSLIRLIYSTNEREHILAKGALRALLGYHKEKPETLCLLLDCLSKLSQNSDSVAGSRKGSTFDADRVLELLSEWAKNVDNWHIMVGPLIDKMLAEPSNAVIVRFLSHISEYLAEAVDLVFHRLILYAREQKGEDSSSRVMEREDCLFSRICPLLIIRLLPLTVFDKLDSTLIYGGLSRISAVDEDGDTSIANPDCIATLIMNRALNKSEFEDVRKLAAELCGRIHPEVLIPILCTQLELATSTKDVMKIKVCLFSLCTALMARGSDAYRQPDVITIRKTIEEILLWSSIDSDEVSKAQHGCIDCLALMLCTEVQVPKIAKGGAISTGPVLEYVIHHLTQDKKDTSSESDLDVRISDATPPLSFRLCMANVLISACQKIPDTGKKSLVRILIPRVIRIFEVTVEPEIKAACVQVLFTVAYHLKSWILIYSNELLRVALKSLREGSSKEKMVGAKLLACLMAGEEDVVESISPGLLQATTLLQNLYSTDPSTELGQICQQLLVCFSSH